MPVYTYTTLDDPFAVGATTPALGINSTGQIVGNYRNFGGTHGFLYSGGTDTAIDDPLATGVTIAFGINTSGQIVGDYNDGTTHGFTRPQNPSEVRADDEYKVAMTRFFKDLLAR